MTALPIGELVRTRRVIVCCGAGGVGKTTTAAALSLAAARAGRRVLVLTIDPSKRLAETLGVARNPPAPVAISEERRKAAGITTGSLHAWMLDPKLVADEAIRRLVKSPADAERVLTNRIYQQVSQMVAGMHEYTAMEALHRFVSQGAYDLVVLDTPPSRHALDFLEAPKRLAGLVEGRALQAFLPKKDSLVTRAASRVLERVLGAVFGEEFASEFIGFLFSFSAIFAALNVDVNEMRAFLSGPDVAFLLVTSPAPETLAEALFFREKTQALGLPFRGFVLNRSRARNVDDAWPDEKALGDLPPEARAGLPKLQALAHVELEAAKRHAGLLGDLRARAGSDGVAMAVPELPQGADDLATLLSVADALASA